MFKDRYIVIDNCILPHVFLEYFEQVNAEAIALVYLEHLAEYALAILDAAEGLANEIVALVRASYEKIALLFEIGDR